jgi:hypothetical protein
MPRHHCPPSRRLVSRQQASTVLRPAANSATRSGMPHKAEAPSSAPTSHRCRTSEQGTDNDAMAPSSAQPPTCRDNEQAPSSAPLPTQPASWGWPTKLRHLHPPHRSLVAMPASEPCGPPCHRLVVAPASKRWPMMPGHRCPPPRRRLVIGQASTHHHPPHC